MSHCDKYLFTWMKMDSQIIRNYLSKIDTVTLNEVTLSKNSPGQQFMVSDSAEGKQMRADLLSKGLALGSGRITYVDIKSVDTETAISYGNPNSKTAYAFETELSEFFICYKNPPIVYLRGSASQLKLTAGGETAEGVLGAAMFAKFIKRETRERIGTVTEADVYSALEKIHAAPGNSVDGKVITVTVKDAEGDAEDRVSFHLVLKTAAYNDLMNPAMKQLLTPFVQSAVGYVNSERAEEYARYFYLNGKDDDLAVVSAGPTDEKTSKADVRLIVKTKDGKISNTKLNTSLKIGGIEQFGQVYGTNGETIIQLYKYLGVDISDKLDQFNALKKKNTKEAIQFLYNSAEKEMTKSLAADRPGQEARFVDKLASGIIHFATLGNPDVEIVDFDKSTFKIMRFETLQEKLRNAQLIVTCPTDTAQPVLLISDKNNPSKRLIKIRCKIENTPVTKAYPDGMRVRHYVEKGKFLEELTLVTTKSQTSSEVDLDTDEKLDQVINGHLNLRPPGSEDGAREKHVSSPRSKR